MTFLKTYWKPLSWTIVILFLCLMPKSVEPKANWLTLIPYFDKLIHLGLYSILGLLFMLARKQNITLGFVSIIIIYALCLGGSIELIQPFVGRSNELMDLIADIVGTISGIGIFYFVRKLIDIL